MEANGPRPRLYRQLNQYCSSDAYPFHMPGHKRQLSAEFLAEFPNPYGIDITEIDGFDNLHHAEGLLRESMDWAASVYGAARTCYLVNGSTCGVLAAVCAAVPWGGTILMDRGSHKSAYHAAALNGLNIQYVYPQILEEFGLRGGVLPQDIEKMLVQAKDNPVGAVLITSPTYDGVVSDVGGIAEICHRHGLPLIVDEAHGAHFPFGERFPTSALRCGADIVIQSLHKTLPAFTQSALLHVGAGSERIDIGRLEYFLQVFQSSSPSYVLMAGIERCIEYMADEGRGEMDRFADRAIGLRAGLRKMRHLRLLDRDVIGRAGVYDLDFSKIVVSAYGVTGRIGSEMPGSEMIGMELTGSELAELLRRDYHLEVEMCGSNSVTAITTLMDSQEGLARLEEALLEIDAKLEDSGAPEAAVSESATAVSGAPAEVVSGAAEHVPRAEIPRAEIPRAAHPRAVLPRAEIPRAAHPRAVLPIHEALERPARMVLLESAVDRISAEYVYLYPPGTPLIVPGELLTEETVGTIRLYRERRLPIQGMQDHTASSIGVLI